MPARKPTGRPSMSDKKLFLFPGAHKTATTLLQASMEVNRPSLEAEGISIARRQPFYSTGLHAALKKADGLASLSRAQISTCLSTVFNGAPKDKIVISVENIAGEVRPVPYKSISTVIENLRSLFPEHEMQVHFYVRRQDTFIESAFVQEYHVGLRPNLERFIKRFLDRPLDWMRPIVAMSKALSPQQVSVVPYENIREGADAYLASFYRIFSEQDPRILFRNYQEKSPFTNVSISRKGIEILEKSYDVVRDRQGRRSLAALLQERFGTDRYPRFKFSGDQLKRLAEVHRDLNQRLVKRGKFSQEMAAYYLFAARAAAPRGRAGVASTAS